MQCQKPKDKSVCCITYLPVHVLMLIYLDNVYALSVVVRLKTNDPDFPMTMFHTLVSDNYSILPLSSVDS